MLKMVPGMGVHADQMDVEDKDLSSFEAIIQSMTPRERARPEILNTSRRNRVARGAGVERSAVDDLVKQFSMIRKFMDDFSRVGGKGPLGKIKAIASAKKQMSDIGGMMHKMVEATAPEPPARARQKQKVGAASHLSKDEIRRRRKMERQNKKKNRRR
jgi:signal recognition particle GTPase